MRFAIGYQQPEDGPSFPELAARLKGSVREIYFAWPSAPSGRAPLGSGHGAFNWNAQRILEEDLLELRRMGFALDILFNASCYGAEASSQALEREIISIMEQIGGLCGLPEIATTASFAVAAIIKRRFPGIDVRASVNMKLGSVQAMSYASAFFDSFHLQRDLQRDLNHAGELAAWCHANGKKLCLLANSGCLRFCPAQAFHDNLVAHEAEASKLIPLADFSPILCHSVVQRGDSSIAELLKATWIRPEDLHRYEGVADVVKLATRLHSHPEIVASAYVNGCFEGNLLDLLEPGFSSLIAPRWLDNSAFPPDWAERSGLCRSGCNSCGYCEETLKRVLR